MLINIMASLVVLMMILMNIKLVIMVNANYVTKRIYKYIIFVKISIKRVFA